MSHKLNKLINQYVRATMPDNAVHVEYTHNYFKRMQFTPGQGNHLVTVEGTRLLKPYTIKAVRKAVKKMVRSGELTVDQMKSLLELQKAAGV